MRAPKVASKSSVFDGTKTKTSAATPSVAQPPTTTTLVLDDRIEMPGIILGDDQYMGCEEKKLAWLRSQIVGSEAEFNSPFGKRKITYADTTASGRSLHYIEDFIVANVLPFYGNTHTSDSYVGHRTTRMVKEASSYIKKILGGGENDALMFCGSGTTAAIKRLQEVMGLAVPSTLRDRMLSNILNDEERWVVFVGPYEHHSNLLSWRQSLAQVIEIGLTENGLIDTDELRVRLEFYKDSNRPMLGSFSACSNVTGICSDTRQIARLLHRYGAFACFDFAASAPHEDIDMKSGQLDGYDAIFLSPHKFVGGPGSPGILLMSNQLYQLSSSTPSTCGGGVVSYVNGFNEKDTIYIEDIEERESAGTPPIIQTIRAALAFWVKDFIGYKTIEAQEHYYIQTALRQLSNNKNIKILGNTSVNRQAILSFMVYSMTPMDRKSSCTDHQQQNDENVDRFNGLWSDENAANYINEKGKPLHGPFVAKLLNDLFGIQARGGCACAGPYGHTLLNVDNDSSLAFRSAIQKGYLGVKPGWTRLSFTYYMSKEEFKLILAAIEFTAQYGHRFLSLYHFNWKTGDWMVKKKALKELVLRLKENNTNSQNCNLPFLTATQEVDKKGSNKEMNDLKEIGVACKYKMYMDTAEHMVMLLPKFPIQRKFPQDLDLELPFRI